MFGLFERLVYPYPDAPPAPPPRGFFAFVWSCTEGLRPYVAGMAALTALVGAFEALLFSMLGHIVDWLAKVPPAELWARERGTLLLLASVLLASPLFVALYTLLKHQTLAGNMPMLLRWNFHRRMLGQSMSFYQDEFAGRVATKVMQTALAARDVVMIVCDILVFIVIYFVTMIAVVGGFDTFLLAPFVGWLLLYAIAVWYFVPRLGRVSTEQADARALMTGRIADAYTNIATVKLFSHARREAGYARSAMQEFIGTVHRQMRLNGISHWIMWEMSSLFEHIGTVQDGINTLARPHAVVDTPGAVPLQVSRGEIRFDEVSFAYGASDKSRQSVIDHLTLHIRAGEKIGLVGRSGAGKSTVVNLLLRFHDVAQGRVLIDGQDIAGVTQDSLRAQVGMVTQDTSLLHRSVADNILYGRPDATEAQMVAASKRAEAHEFILGLSDPKGREGYEAHVGERGVKLSGGQRQRIAIARVMLKDAPILLLDEATSALDSEVEAAIQASLYRLMEGKTVVAIAHRLSTIAAMDRLIVLDKGRIVEEGDHRSLLARGGLYARLWAHQSGGFLGEEPDDDAHDPSAPKIDRAEAVSL